MARVEFIDENGGGPGVRLRNRQKPKQSKWARPSGAMGHVSTLVRVVASSCYFDRTKSKYAMTSKVQAEFIDENGGGPTNK